MINLIKIEARVTRYQKAEKGSTPGMRSRPQGLGSKYTDGKIVFRTT